MPKHNTETHTTIQCHFSSLSELGTRQRFRGLTDHTTPLYNRFTAFFWDHPGEPVPEVQKKTSGLYGARGD